MKKIIAALFVLLSITILAEKITIVTNDYEPYTKLEGKKETGVFVEIVNRAFEEAGLSVVYEKYPWRRNFAMVENNEADASIPWFKTPKREEKFIFTAPVIMCVNKFFYVRGGKMPENFEWKTLSDFKNFRVGGVLGYWYEESFKRAGVETIRTFTDDNNIRHLGMGGLDTFLTSEYVGWALIEKHFPENVNDFATLSKPESEAPMYLIVSKENPNGMKLVERFNAGLEKIKKSGEYDIIIAKYLR